MVERRHGAGDGEGMKIGGRYRAREAKIFGRCRHRRENEQGIEPQRAERAITQLAVELALIAVRNRQNVGEENEIEAAVFEDAADIAVVFQRQQVAVGGRVAPSAVMAGNRPRHNEGRQVHLSLFHSPALAWAASPRACLGRAARKEISFVRTAVTVVSFFTTIFFRKNPIHAAINKNTHDPGRYHALTPLSIISMARLIVGRTQAIDQR